MQYGHLITSCLISEFRHTKTTSRLKTMAPYLRKALLLVLLNEERLMLQENHVM